MAISKSQAYLSRIMCVEYDLKGAIEAYGVECLHWLIDEVAAGRIKADKDIQRWSAHAHLYKFASTEIPRVTPKLVDKSEKVVKRDTKRNRKPAKHATRVSA